MATYKFQVTDTSSYPGTQRTITKALSSDERATEKANELKNLNGWNSVVWWRDG